MQDTRLLLLLLSAVCACAAVCAAQGSGALCGSAPSPSTCFVDVPPCDSPLWCFGPVLHAFQTSGLFNDSKTFVDAPLKAHVSVSDVLAAFAALGPGNGSDPAALAGLYAAHFDAPGSDLHPWTPPDWTPEPALVRALAAVNPDYARWAADLNALWRGLGRKVDPDVFARPSAHSLLPVPNGFVVPGGRFREWYNWDTFWILKGLLEMELTDTAAGMLENFAAMIDAHGYVPNGGRVYYTDRSQPPLFAAMIHEVVAASGNTTLARALLPAARKEYQWWMTDRVATTAHGYLVNVYRPRVGMPRPEGYLEDLNHAQGLDSVSQACVFAQLAAGAETGWDFSSRWFADPTDISSICTSTLAPVDLNAFLYVSETTLADLYRLVGDLDSAADMDAAAARRSAAFDAVFWNDGLGMYVDYNVSAAAPASDRVYLSTIVPAWAGLVTHNATRRAMLLDTLTATYGLLKFPGGVPTSLVQSGQQWDLPNAWPPLQFFAVAALRELGDPDAASSLASTWLASNYAAYQSTRLMWEKYNATQFGVPGGGGEYTVATGFGWTNGVVIAFLRDLVTHRP